MENKWQHISIMVGWLSVTIILVVAIKGCTDYNIASIHFENATSTVTTVK